MKLRVFFSLVTILIMVFCRLGTAVDDSAVLYFSFDEGKGNAVKDSSLGKNDGTIQGNAKWVKGKMGQAMRFEGKGFVEVPHAKNLNLTQAHTIAYWLKWDGLTTSWSPFIAKTSGGGAKEDNFHTWVGKDQVWDYENQPFKQRNPLRSFCFSFSVACDCGRGQRRKNSSAQSIFGSGVSLSFGRF